MMNYHFDNHLLMVIVSRFLMTTKDGVGYDKGLLLLSSNASCNLASFNIVLGIEVLH